LISPEKDCRDLEEIVTQVNDQKTELNIVAETIVPSHVVKLAGIKLPLAPPPPPPPATAVVATNVTGKNLMIIVRLLYYLTDQLIKTIYRCQ
jgi:hypothetical protein